MAETTAEALDVQQLLLGGKPDAQRYRLLRKAQGRSGQQRRQLERLVIELMENPTVEGKELPADQAALVVGVGLWALGRIEEALASLAAASSPEADYFVGLCHYESGRYSRAAEAFERAQRGKAATKHVAAIGHARAIAIGGRPDQALTAARALAKSHPDDPAVHELMGISYDLLCRYEDAIAAYEKAIELAPGDPTASFRLGYVHALRGDPDAALEHYQAAAGSGAEYENALINLGVLYEDRRDYDKAIECYRRVLRVDPNHPRGRMFLKDAHASLDMVFDEDRERELERRTKLLGVPVSDFEFSVRVRNCLVRMDIHTLGDLARMTEEELLGSRNFGDTSLQEIKEVLGARGLHLGEAREEAAAALQPAAEEAAAGAPVAAEPDEAAYGIPIGELELSLRSRKCMERLGIETIGQLIEHTTEELLASRNFGRTSLAEVNEKLVKFGLSLREPEEPEEAEDEEGEEQSPDGLPETADDAE